MTNKKRATVATAAQRKVEQAQPYRNVRRLSRLNRTQRQAISYRRFGTLDRWREVPEL